MASYTDAGLVLHNNHLTIKEPQFLRSVAWDKIVYAAVFGDQETRIQSRYVIGEVARQRGIQLCSINALYLARGRGELEDDFTVPALNLRGMAYDSARAIFEIMVRAKVGPVIFEISSSECEYTGQSPEEYAAVVQAAAIREGYRGPIFLQADHTQFRAAMPGVAEENEYSRLEHHISRCLRTGFYNIDIDGSTLVDLSAPEVEDQQRANVEATGQLVRYVRQDSPSDVVVSVGGEIGHIGDRNSTIEDFTVFMDGLRANLGSLESIHKVSVQTGTTHGGMVNKDGSLGKMSVDFDLLRAITEAGKAYEVGGSVQHGASTLPDSDFHLFPYHETLEIHLATGWQNILFDSPAFPTSLKQSIYDHLLTAKQDHSLTDPQYIYKNRKHAWGTFKRESWDIDSAARTSLRAALASHAENIFESLNVTDRAHLATKYATTTAIIRSIHDYQGD